MTVTYEGAAEQVRQVVHHHAVLRRGLERRAGALCEAAENGVRFHPQMRMLREYLTGEILPHAQAEERTLYPAAATRARGSGRLTLTAEHRELCPPRRSASARHGRHRGRRSLGTDRDVVRRARGQGERPAAARTRRLRRGPGRPARGHASRAGCGASVMPGGVAHLGVPRRPAAARHIRGRECQTA
ncbi:MAG TPA: hypothetical protein DHU96_19495 [Actinobacteria bacterium]|nr:hypothetical protein [Actinomycetota bacterium]